MSADAIWLLLAAYVLALNVAAFVMSWRNRHTYRAKDRRYYLQRDDE
jgi:hypothetical protein